MGYLEVNGRRVDAPVALAIPEIGDFRLRKLGRIIKPLVRSDGELYHIEPVDYRSIAFAWDPKLTEQAQGLNEVATIPTLHTYGYYGLFKPTVAEVLAQIPREIQNQVEAFEVLGPRDRGDLSKQWDVVNAGFHLAATVLYSSRPPVNPA